MKIKKVLFPSVIILFLFIFALTSFAVNKPLWAVKDMVRTEYNPGIRFCAKIDVNLRNDEALEEYGFIVTSRERLDNEFISVSDFSHECDFEYAKIANYRRDEENPADVWLEMDEEWVTFSCVVVNIPNERYNSHVIAKAYLKYAGEYYYSVPISITYFAAAKNVKQSEDYSSYDDGRQDVIEDIISVGKGLETVRIVSCSDIAEDSEGKWRNYYKLYNPYTGRTEENIPSATGADKAGKLHSALEAGTVISFDGYAVEDTNEEYIKGSAEYPVWITEADAENGTIGVHDAAHDYCGLELDRYMPEREGFVDIYGNQYDVSVVKLKENAGISVIEHNVPEQLFTYGTIKPLTFSDLAAASKNIRGYNDACENDDGEYVTSYNKYVKSYVSVCGEDENGTPIVDFVLVVVNGHEKATEGTTCSWCAHEESVKKERIIIGTAEPGEDAEGKIRVYYTLFDPQTASISENVPSKQTYSSLKEAQENIVKYGTVVIFSNGYVRKTVSSAQEQNLVWIKKAGEDGTLDVVPYDGTLKCKDCIREYVEGYEYDEEAFFDIHGHRLYSDGTVKTDSETHFSAIGSTLSYKNVFYSGEYIQMSYSELPYMRCFNTRAKDDNGEYYTGESDYVKAFISADSDISGNEAEAEYVICVVNGYENSALDEKCEKHSFVIEEEPEEPEMKAGYRIVTNYDLEMDVDGKWRIYYELINPYTGKRETGVPSVRSEEKAKELTDALETGTVIYLDSKEIDDENSDIVKGVLSEENFIYIGNIKNDGTIVASPYISDVSCRSCLITKMNAAIVNEEGINDIVGNKILKNFIPVTENTAYSVIRGSTFGDNMLKRDSVSPVDAGTNLVKDKNLRCFNEAEKADGTYKTVYSDFVKAFIMMNDEGEAEFVLVVVNGDEYAALGISCEKDEGFIMLIPESWK